MEDGKYILLFNIKFALYKFVYSIIKRIYVVIIIYRLYKCNKTTFIINVRLRFVIINIYVAYKQSDSHLKLTHYSWFTHNDICTCTIT